MLLLTKGVPILDNSSVPIHPFGEMLWGYIFYGWVVALSYVKSSEQASHTGTTWLVFHYNVVVWLPHLLTLITCEGGFLAIKRLVLLGGPFGVRHSLSFGFVVLSHRCCDCIKDNFQKNLSPSHTLYVHLCQTSKCDNIVLEPMCWLAVTTWLC